MTDLQQGAPAAPPAGWYEDPVRPGSTRYWSGSGWTDQVNAPVAETAAEPAVVPIGAMFDAGPAMFDVGSVAEPPRVTFGAPPAPRENHASQSEWHQTRARPVQRVALAPVSTTTRAASGSAGGQRGSYDRNWIAGMAIVLAVLSIPAIAVRVLWDLPPLTQSIVAGAPIGISLLAFARAARNGTSRVLPLIAVGICAASLVAAWVVDPELIRGIVESVAGLLPA